MANNLDSEIEQLSRVLAGLREDLAGLGQAAASGSGNTSQASAAQASYNEELKKAKAAQAAYTKSVETAIGGLKAFGKGMSDAALSTDQSMYKYSGAISAAGNAIGQFAGNFGPWGKAIELGIKGFTALTSAVLKQNDAILKSYDGLSQLGATARLSTDEILQLGMKAGYSSKNLEGLYKSAKSLEGGLIALGGSSSEGIKAFATIANIGDEARSSFRMLGFSQEEVTEMQADYVKQIAKVGGTLAKSPKELSEESQRYITNLTALSELTGKSVKEQQKAREQALAQENLNAYLNNLEQKRIAAVESGNTAEADRIKKQVESTQAYAAHIVATESAESATAKLQSMATDGAVVLGKNNAMMRGMGYNFDKVNEALRKGESPMKMMFLNAEQNANVNKRATQMFGDNLYRLGDTSLGLQKLTSQTNQQRENQVKYDRYMKLSADERSKVDKMTTEDALAYLAAKKKSDDGTLAADADRQEAEREYKQAIDAFTRMFSGWVNPTVSLFYTGLKFAATIIKGFVDVIQTIGEVFTDLKDTVGDFIDGMRDNVVLQKMFGLKGLTDQEKHAKEVRDREKEEKHKLRKEALWGKEDGGVNKGALAGAAAGMAAGGPVGAVVGAIAGQKMAAKPGEAGPAPLGQPSPGAGGFDMTRYLQQTALIESGGKANAKAGTSSAGGMFQFIDSTWNSMVKQMGKNYTLQDKYDPKKSAEVMAFFTNQQKSQLEKMTGSKASNVDMYMAHFLGAGGAGKFLNQMKKDPTAIAASLDPKAAAANKSIYYDASGKPRTVQEVYSLMSSKVGKAETALQTGKWGKEGVPETVMALGAGPGQTAPAMPQVAAASPAAGGVRVTQPTPDKVRVAVQPTQQSATAPVVQTAALPETASGGPSDAYAKLIDLMDSKLTALISAVQNGNDTQGKILRYSKA